jgi:hypothetical protein
MRQWGNEAMGQWNYRNGAVGECNAPNALNTLMHWIGALHCPIGALPHSIASLPHCPIASFFNVLTSPAASS